VILQIWVTTSNIRFHQNHTTVCWPQTAHHRFSFRFVTS